MKTYKGYIQPHGSSFRACFHQGGERIRATFKTREMAMEWLVRMNRDEPMLSQSQLRDATEAVQLLPDGVTLVECVRHYVECLPEEGQEVQDLESIANAFLADRENDLRSSTLANYRRVLSHALGRFDYLHEITTEAMREWTNGLTPHNKNRVLRSMSAFFGWLIEREMASSNPVEGIKLAKVDAPKREVLTLAQVEALLRAVKETNIRLMPYVSICLFAGVRPDECKKLTRDNIGNGYIIIGEGLAKTHSARTVPIAPNLANILDRYPIEKVGVGLGLPYDGFKKKMREVIKASGITWANDIMRHSYASYEYERTGDAARTASNLGHMDTSMLFQHYRGLVPPGSGEKFFTIEI